jgi:flagellar basal-body rod protein FlgB
MSDLNLFGLAARKTEWLSVRESVISSNVANAGSPGYEARDVEPFDRVLDKTHVQLARTEVGHIDIATDGIESPRAKKTDSWDVYPSGNSVSLEQELIKSGEVQRDYSLATNITRSFRRMLSTAIKG